MDYFDGLPVIGRQIKNCKTDRRGKFLFGKLRLTFTPPSTLFNHILIIKLSQKQLPAYFKVAKSESF